MKPFYLPPVHKIGATRIPTVLAALFPHHVRPRKQAGNPTFHVLSSGYRKKSYQQLQVRNYYYYHYGH